MTPVAESQVMKYITPLCSAGMLALASQAAFAMNNDELHAIALQRLSGDRSGACMAMAVVEKNATARAFTCADQTKPTRINTDSAFEIGSVSKTMTAALLAEWIVRGAASLDDALADWLPEGAHAPDFNGEPILLHHIVTHTSGLPGFPPELNPPNPEDPYADFSEDTLLNVLQGLTLETAPGAHYEYSNFAMMLLSSAIARRAGTDFETWLKQRLFEPLGMCSAYINAPPEGVKPAAGHASNAKPAPSWHFATDIAGVGGVRATLEDMVHYVEGVLGWRNAAISPALADALKLAQQPINDEFAMNWQLLPVNGRIVHMHEGATGGFSSFVAVDHEHQRGVVVLSDTAAVNATHNLGGHLLDASLTLDTPRKHAIPPQELLDALVGEYQLEGAMVVTLRQREGQLFIHPEGQDEYPLHYDDHGDFFLLIADATLRPQQQDDGRYAFIWLQGGAAMPAVRVENGGVTEIPTQDLQAYVGQYPLLPGLSLSIRVHRGRLEAQASGQSAFTLAASGVDRFAAPAFGIAIEFKRDARGEVESLDLHQGGQVLSGKRTL